MRPPAPPVLLLSHGEEFEERARLASEAVARIDLYVELLCLEAVGRVVVEYTPDLRVRNWQFLKVKVRQPPSSAAFKELQGAR